MKLTLTQKSVIRLIKDDEAYSNYFFGRYDKVKLFPTLKEEGFFNPENNPSPKKVKGGYQIPAWNVLPYLERLSKKTRRLDNELLEIIKSVSLYENKDSRHTDNDRTRWFFVKILSNIPLSNTPIDIFDDVIPTWLESDFDLILPGAELSNELLSTYLDQAKTNEDITKVEKLISIILTTKEEKLDNNVFGKSRVLRTRIEDHWLEEAFIKKGYSTLIAQKCTNQIIFDLANNIKSALSKSNKKHDYSSIWLSDLSSEYERTSDNAEYFLAQILRKLLLEKIKIQPDEGAEVIDKFLSDEYPHYLFKRLAILMIARNWDVYKHFFDQILDDTKEGYFDFEVYWPELFHLFSINTQNLTKNQKSKLKALIEEGPKKDLPDEKKESYSLYWKQVWYKSLSKLSEFKKLYEKTKLISKKDYNLPSYGKVVAFRDDSFDKSPVSPEGFIEKNNQEVVRYLLNYKPAGNFYHSSPEGVYKAFQSAVETNPNKFTSDLTPFVSHDYHMLSSLFNGFEEAWKNKNDINWESIINFTSTLIQEDWFWKPTDKDKSIHYNYFSWTISAIGDLFKEGCRSDDHAFSEQLHPNIENIFNTLITKLKFDEKSYQGDGMSHALNSSWGKVITALIYLGLRQARISDKKQEKKSSKWSVSIKSDFQMALDKKIFEAFTLLGNYFPNLHYVDKEWAILRATDVLANKDERYFATFMEGYLYNSKVYKPIYLALRKHYKRAIKITFKEKQIENQLIQHIAIWYLYGVEKLNSNSLVDQIFISKNFEQVREFVEYLWHKREYITDDKITDKDTRKEQQVFKERIIVFWRHTSEIIEKRNAYTEDEKKVLSELSKMAVYLDNLDESSFKLMMHSASYVTEDFDSPYFIKYLNRLKGTSNKTKTAEYIGNLFLEMLNKAEGRIPDYKWENIVEIVEHLYQVGQSSKDVKELANSICDFYFRFGNDKLRSIYEKYNAS